VHMPDCSCQGFARIDETWRDTEILPWLQGLKQQLRALEWLMERHFPALAAHLQVFAYAYHL
jgi:hypothetical protein